MKTERNILIAFILNLSFSVFEFFGGMITGSVAVLSDAFHDMADAASIGISYILEKVSKKQPDEVYTYGYARYSVIGSLVTTTILLFGSITMIIHAVQRMIAPTAINYNGMILFAVVGVCVNLCAAFVTRRGNSLNQKAVNLHMLEDVLGWIVVLVGAIVMRFTNWAMIDPVMCIGVSVYILIHAIKNLKEVFDIFLEKIPQNMDIGKIKECVLGIADVIDVHHIHLWTLDGHNHYATMHIVSDSDSCKTKDEIRKELHMQGINHMTIEFETSKEDCHEKVCNVVFDSNCGHCHHGHHSH